MASDSTEPELGGHLEFPVSEQLTRARPWSIAEQPVVGDLSDEEEIDFMQAIRS